MPAASKKPPAMRRCPAFASRWCLRAATLLLGLLAPLPGPAAPPFVAATTAALGLEAATPGAPEAQRRRRQPRYRGQLAPTAHRIREIQSALAEAGFYKREPNGKWDSYSVEALKKFQQANGLKPTGKLDALSLQKLGLGSEVAGVASPRQTAEKEDASQLNKKSGTPD